MWLLQACNNSAPTFHSARMVQLKQCNPSQALPMVVIKIKAIDIYNNDAFKKQKKNYVHKLSKRNT